MWKMIPPLGGRSDLFSGGKKLMEVILQERVPVFASGLGNPEHVIGLVGNVKNARRLAKVGVHLVVAQGYEAGLFCQMSKPPAQFKSVP
jgi:NAD(P)H-dependent flavin oxidoreductase YrpB (nitropropane dioxygenase family)